MARARTMTICSGLTSCVLTLKNVMTLRDARAGDVSGGEASGRQIERITVCEACGDGGRQEYRYRDKDDRITADVVGDDADRYLGVHL
ncbi:hypothetical protein MRX96_024172 [Rhipicephalus microplus]